MAVLQIKRGNMGKIRDYFTYFTIKTYVVTPHWNLNITISNLVQQTGLSVFNFFSITKTQKLERKQLMGRSQQATISPLQATFTDAF